MVIQTGFAEAAPVAAKVSQPAIAAVDLPSRRDGPQPAPVTDISIPPGAATGGPLIDPSIGARTLDPGAPPPRVATEIESARTERSRLVANPDGTFTLENSVGRLHYRNDAGAWAPIDLRLVPDGVDRYELRTAANDRTVRFASADGSAAAAELSADGRTIRLRVPGAGPADRVVDAREVVDRLAYRAAPGAPSVYIQPNTEGVSFGAIWSDALTAPVAEIVLDLDGYVARVAADGVSVELLSADVRSTPAPRDPAPPDSPQPDASPGIETTPPATTSLTPSGLPTSSPSGVSPLVDASSEPAATALPEPSPSAPPETAAPSSPEPSSSPSPSPGGLPTHPDPIEEAIDPPSTIDPAATVIGTISAPVILEGLDGRLTSAPVTVVLLPGPAAGEVRLRYLLDPLWLAAPDREFPIELDPSICVQAGGSGCQTGGSVVNTYIGSGQPNTYPNPPSILRVGHDDLPDVDWNTLRSLIWFSPVTLADGAMITAATVRLRQTDNRDLSSTPQIYARSINTSWGSTSTWSQMSNAVRTGYDSPVVAPCSNNTTDCDLNLDVESAARAWYTRRAKAWKSNWGIQVRLANEGPTVDEVDFYVSSGCTNTTCPKLTITYEIHKVAIDFDPLLGTRYAPSSMIAGQTTTLPVVVTNNGSAIDFTTTTYRVGYRWFDAKGYQGTLPSDVTALPGCVGSGSPCPKSQGPFGLAVTAPPNPGLYTLRLDLVRLDGSVNLWASDWAKPSLYYSRNKKFLTEDDTRWVGTSVVERDEFSITVSAGGGTNSGERRTVTTGTGDELGIGLASRDLTFRGDTGLGFADRIGLALRYGYSQADVANCSAYQGILGACGWWTTFDERISGGPNESGYDYTYVDPNGDRYLLDTDPNGQITSGAPVLLNRPRHTLLDDNEAPSSTVAAVDAATAGFAVFSGSYANRAASNATAGTGLTDIVNLNVHRRLRFAVRSSSTTRSGLCLKVHNVTDTTTYPDKWWCYTVGSTWTTGFPQVNLGLQAGVASLSAGWNDYSRDMWNDIRLDGAYGTPTDDYQVIAVQIQSDGTGSGFTYVDGLRFESLEVVTLDETAPTWTNGATYASMITPGASDPAVSGTKVLQVTPAGVGIVQPTCRTGGCWTYAGILDSAAFVHWSWKKIGGTTAAIVMYVRDQRSGAPCSSADCSITYYAGEAPPPFGTGLAIQVSATVPDQWTTVRRNLLEDARTALALYDDAGSGAADSVTLAGFGPIAVDGTSLLVDHFGYGSLPDVSSIDPTGEVAAFNHPSSVGDTTRVWDFTADDADGRRHYFNRDGLLTAIRDLDGYALNLDWTVIAPTTGPASYRLDKVRAPLDGTSSGGVTFEREFAVSRGTDGALATLRFDEVLGSTSDDRSARAAIFETTTGSEPDLVKVSPARHVVGAGATGTFCGTAPSGCVEFSYVGSHQLTFVADPRWTGATSGAGDLRFEVVRTGAEPMAIRDRSHGTGGTALLNILTYADSNVPAPILYDRVQYQDAASAAANHAIALDLTPEGNLLTGYAPRACTGTCTTTPATWPGAGTQDDFKTVRHEFDGLARVNTVRTYRCPTSTTATTGCTSGVEQISLSREARNAGAKVDNYIDPLSSAETAWRQTPEQWFASVRDSGGANPDLYRTEYRYDGRHRLVHTREPVGLAVSTYPETIKATPGLTSWWRLDEASGAALNSAGGPNGTVNGPTRDRPGLLVRTTPNKAYDFDGSNDRVTAATSLNQTAYSIEAWVRPGANVGGKAIAGDYLGAAGGAMLWTDSSGRYTFVHTSTSSNYLTPGPKLTTNRTDHVVGTWNGKEMRLYVNGALVGAKPMTTTPGVGASNFEIGMAANSAAYPFDGRIDDVALYSRALEPDEVRTHYAAGVAMSTISTRIGRDRVGRVTDTADQFAANGAFETGLANWTTTGSPSTSATAQRTGAPGGAGAVIPATASVSQIVSVVPGQTVRFQYYQSGFGGGLAATVAATTPGGSTWDLPVLSSTNTSSSWTGHAWDLVVPIGSDGRLKITFAGSGSGNAYLDDVVLLTRWTSTTYVATAGPSFGLPSSIDTLLPGCSGCSQATVRATLGYAAGTSAPNLHPAMFATTTIANDVATVSDPTTQDVTSSTTYDAWGRVITTTDPDGVTATTTYGTNGTDVASTADDPDNGTAVTTYTYDAVGNRLTVTSPLGRTTTTTYDGLNRPLTVTAPDGTISRTDVNDHGQAIRTWANYQNGTTTDGDGSDDLLTTTDYDAYGRVTTTRAECAATAGVANCASGLDAQTAATYDLTGATVTSTVAAAAHNGSPRTTTARFETYQPTIGAYSGLTATRLTSTGTRLAIAPNVTPAPACPDGSGFCNTVTTLDLSGRVVATTDAYGVVTTLDLDLDGRIVRTTLNDTPGTGHGSDNDENLVTLTRYDLLGRTERTTTVIDGTAGDRWTRQLYDPLGRVTETIDGSGVTTLVDRTSTRTRYTAGGRVERVSSTEVATADDAARSWTRTEYDADGRAVRTVARAEQGGLARRFIDHFEGGTAPSWSTSATGTFTLSAAASGPSFDPQASPIAPANGRHRLRVTTSAGGASSGAWRDYSGRTFTQGVTYRLRASLWAPNGTTVAVSLGVDAAGTNKNSANVSGTGAWQAVSLDWMPSATVSTNVHAAFAKAVAGSVDIALDDVMLTEVGAANDYDVPSDSVYDLDGRVITSITPPGDAAVDVPLVTTSAADGLDRLVVASTNAREPYAAAVRATAGYTGSWPLDEAGGTAIDDRGSATDLTAAGGRIAGVAGGLDEARTALRFDGATGHATRTSTPLSATDGFALEAWFRYDVVPSGSQVLAYNGTSTTGWGVGFNAGKLAGVYGSTWLDSGQVPAAGRWHHVVLTRSGGTATIYLDGTAFTPTNSTATPSTPGASFAIGRQDATAGRYFAGDIDEVAIYAQAMTAPTVAAHWAAGRQVSTTEGLTTRSTYDRLGRMIESSDPAQVRTRFGYDRLGGLTSTIQNYIDGSASGATAPDDVQSTFARNVLGELVGYCSGKNIWDAAAGFGSCDPSSPSNTYAWHYVYDDLGRMVTQVPPDNAGAADLDATAWQFEVGGRLDKTCEGAAGAPCTSPNRQVDLVQDALGRTKSEAATKGAQTITTTTAYGVDGQPTSIAQGGSTISVAYVPETGLPASVSTNSTVTTAYTWAQDGTLTSRVDGASGAATNFGYDWAKRLIAVTPTSGTGFGTSAVTQAWRLDGLLGTKSWPNGETATLGYDSARRPVSIGLTGARSLSRAYDRVGNVTTDDRSLGGGISGAAGSGALAHTYDALGRVLETKLSGATLATYTYDRSSNRVIKTEGGSTFTYTFDRTDALVSQKIGAGTAASFTHDGAGNMTVERTKAGVARTYTYDAANRLTKIDDPTGNDADLTYDPLDRIATRTVGTDVQTFSYVGTTEVTWKWAGTTTTSALVGPDGARLGSKTGSTASWLLFDLLGSVAAAEGTSGTTITDALRTDAYGQTIGLYPATGSELPVRFRGLVDLAPTADRDVAGAGSDALYAMGARLYSPHLGGFTSLDTYAGRAQDPASLNRYLYAHANPATLIDPTGHAALENDGPGSTSQAEIEKAKKAKKAKVTQSKHAGGAKRAGSSRGPKCSAATLSCSWRQLDAMSPRKRLEWVEQFQSKWETEGWFNAIEEVLLFAEERDAFRGSDTWSSAVDAHILAAIQDGKRIERGLTALGPSGSGGELWADFFTLLSKRQERGRVAALKALWGPAEQAATDYGVVQADRIRRPQRQELALKNVTDIWRWSVGHGPGFDAASAHYRDAGPAPGLIVGEPISYLSTDFFQPQQRTWIRPMARVLWGQFYESPILIPWQHSPLQVAWDFIGLP